MRFRDRAEAGERLARRLTYLRKDHPVVLALPRGGVPVAVPIAQALGPAPLDLLLVRKIGAPGNPEFAIGAVVDADGLEVLLNEETVRALAVPDDDIQRQLASASQEIERRRALYLRGRRPVDLAGRTVILVDDGVATGATMRVALRILARARARRLVLAAPVVPLAAVSSLRAACDEAVFLQTPSEFHAVGAHYGNFDQVEDEEVVALLDATAGWGRP